jgi:hypothetical protein
MFLSATLEAREQLALLHFEFVGRDDSGVPQRAKLFELTKHTGRDGHRRGSSGRAGRRPETDSNSHGVIHEFLVNRIILHYE